MAKFYETYRSLIVAITLVGVYFSSIEKIYGKGFRVKFLKNLYVLPTVCMTIYVLAAVKFQIFDADDERKKVFGCTELLRKKAKMTVRWLLRFGSIIIAGCVAYCMMAYFSPTKVLTHPSGFPYRHQSPDFELVNTLDLVVSYFGCGGLIAFDSMTLALISMEEAQLQHLKSSLAWILDGVSVTDDGEVQINSVGTGHADSDEHQRARAFEEIRKQINTWICHHQQVLRFHSECQKVFSFPLSVKFSYFVLILCLSCFLTLTGVITPPDIAFVVIYCFSNYTIFYISVMSADVVSELGSTIFGDAFEKSWHLYPKDLKSVFHIIQMRSNRPLHYLAFKKYSLSSSSFLKILSSAYSLFTFMLQINKKNEL